MILEFIADALGRFCGRSTGTVLQERIAWEFSILPAH
jgi:hypothetical protein